MTNGKTALLILIQFVCQIKGVLILSKRKLNLVQNSRKRTKIKRKKKIVLLLSIALIICIVFAVSTEIGKKLNLSSAFPYATAKSEVVENITNGNMSNNTKSDVNEEEWSLILVNKWNMLPANSDIKITELSNGKCVDSRIYPALQKMFDAARADSVYPIVASGYRTEDEQKKLYNDKISAYRKDGMSYSEAKKETELWVAAPGTSEHQLGLAVDINADGIHSKGTDVYNWLKTHAHLYGFINRYPSDKTDITGVANEPWHYRYVGVKAAGEIYKQDICLEEYLEKSN